ncbi:hypothetical protein [Sphingomonas pseudosanguinis]|uniref:hypothetical protein n=1 Tax=Sphingomonas pseudosanguinis TaxID=413712 RepID=UPI00391C1CA8
MTVTNGSNVVTGAGTDFVANASIGDAFIGPDGRTYEIAQIVSATDLRLTTGYQAATGGGQTYAIQPTQSFARDLALAAAALLGTFAAVRDGVGQGLFGDGSAAAPTIRFSADQDTGIRRSAANALALVAGGLDRLIANADGIVVPGHIDVGIGRFVASNIGDIFNVGDQPIAHYGMTLKPALFGSERGTAISGYGGVAFYSTGTERARFDASGNLLVGASSGANHRIQKAVTEGVTVLSVGNGTTNFIFFNSVASQQWSNAATAMSVGRHSGNGRSINAGGTLNANGADYAEYMLKAAGCGAIAKGDVCGVDRDGRLTKTWADAISFVVKSTDPSLVGGDTWAAHLPPRPEAPDVEPQSPMLPTVPAEDADDAEVATYRDALAAYPALVAQYRVDHDAWAAATAAYERDLPAWEAELEAARICVDRIAFCGQVPCNVSGDFEVGDYIVAAANGGGIKAVAMKLDDMTLAQYARRIGKVWAIRDGRAWIDVQHG